MLPVPSTGSSLTRFTFTATPVSCGPKPSMARFTSASRDAYSHHNPPAAASVTPAAPISTAVRSLTASSVQLHVLVVHRQVVDSALGRRDPGGHLPRVRHFLHQRMDERPVRLRGDPLLERFPKKLLGNQPALRVRGQSRPGADRAAKARRGQGEAQIEAGALDLAVPALEPDLAVLEVGLAHDL